MKKISRILAIVLALVMVLSGSVFAAWVSFQNDDTNNGVITGTAPTSNFHVNSLQLPQGMYVGVDVPPVIDSDGYAYVLESAPTTTRLVKVDLANAAIVTTGAWAGTGSGNEGIEIRNVSAFQLSTPVIDGDNIYVASTDFAQKNDDECFQTLNTLSSAWTKTYASGYDTPTFTPYAGSYVYVTDNNGFMNLSFTLSQTFEGVAGDNLRIECAALGNELQSGSYRVYLNNSTTPLVDFDLTQTVGHAFNNSVSHAALVTGTNTIKIEIICSSTKKNPYVMLGEFRLYEESGSVLQVNRSSGATNIVVDGIPGQLNTPLTIKNNKLYFGSYYAGGGKYYQVDINGTLPATAVPFNSGVSHYWDGAYVNSTYAYFGGYSGMLFYPDVSSFGTVIGKPDNGESDNGKTVTGKAHANK